MFNKLKQFRDLRSQAKTMQNTLAQETIKEERNGSSIKLNGNLEILEISLNPDLSNNDQADNLKKLLNEAIKKAQKIMAKKMQEMGGIPGLS
jgi:DNA-binding protein YbaB